ncbi:MAG TPA: hypothetical protein VMJ32_17705 [Pirellulales bacterium]|nr:hypothetical protein [Pirellulales bacterium]
MCQRILPFATIWLLMFGLIRIPRAAQAVEFGSQALPDGGVEYLVQVDPDLLNSFPQQGITSDIPSNLQGHVRRIHITIGSGALPNQGDIIGPKSAAADPKNSNAWNPDANNPTTKQPVSSSAEPPAENTASAGERLNLPAPPSMDEKKFSLEPNFKSASPQLTSATPASPTPASPVAASPPANQQPANSTPANPPPAELPRSLTSLPFFHLGQLKNAEPAKTAGSVPKEQPENPAPQSPVAAGSTPPGPVVAAGQADQLPSPRLTENEGPPANSRTFAADRFAVGAAKPSISDSGWTAGKPDGQIAAAAPKPWLPFMAALLALFASLGANAYLAWIHQGVRAKYRALVQRLPANSLPAM